MVEKAFLVVQTSASAMKKLVKPKPWVYGSPGRDRGRSVMGPEAEAGDSSFDVRAGRAKRDQANLLFLVWCEARLSVERASMGGHRAVTQLRLAER